MNFTSMHRNDVTTLNAPLGLFRRNYHQQVSAFVLLLEAGQRRYNDYDVDDDNRRVQQKNQT